MSLSNREKQLLIDGPYKALPKQNEEKKEDVSKLESVFPEVKLITWKSNSEWQCPFCARTVSNGSMQCGTKKSHGCGARRMLYGSLDFSYMTQSGRIADTASMEQMKHKIREMLSGK